MNYWRLKMEIQVVIKPKDEFNTENLDWSEPVPIEEFILDPHNVQFEWRGQEEYSLPYNDFIFFGGEYWYKILIDDKEPDDLRRYLDEIEEKAWKYDELH